MSESKAGLGEIFHKWHVAVGEEKTRKDGGIYLDIGTHESQNDKLNRLATTYKNQGYTEEQATSKTVEFLIKKELTFEYHNHAKLEKWRNKLWSNYKVICQIVFGDKNDETISAPTEIVTTESQSKSNQVISREIAPEDLAGVPLSTAVIDEIDIFADAEGDDE